MGAILEVWIPALLFGNAFAFFWIFLMLAAVNPSLAKLSRMLGLGSKQPDGGPETKRKTSFMVAGKLSQDLENPPVDASSEMADEHDHCPKTVARRITKAATVAVKTMTLEWRNVGLTYKTGTSEKTVLQGVYGKALPNEMLALMGPSGAGKSTLLDILTMRKNTGEIKGEVVMNGEARQTNFLRVSSYVPQEDNFMPTMTTRETLLFYARLVLPSNTSVKEKQQRVNEVLVMVGLDGQKNTMVGGTLPGGLSLRGLSGGERRRLSIAVGVVSSPSIIFLDEPTSGLDSFAALNVMQYMKSMAQLKSHTIVASIHQPRMSIWNMFDKATLLSKGKLMYWGPTAEILPWFSDTLGYEYNSVVHGVVSDWVMDLVSIGFSKPEEHYGKTMRTEEDVVNAAKRFMEKYMNDVKGEGGDISSINIESEEGTLQPVVRKKTTHYMVDVQALPDPEPNPHESSVHRTTSGESTTALAKQAAKYLFTPILKQEGYNSNWFIQTTTLFWRAFLNITRNPADVAGRMLTFTYVGLFIGIIFYDLDDGSASIWTRLNIIYNSVAFFMFIPYVSMSLFTSDRRFYSADISARLYHPSAYYMANVTANLPFGVANAAVFAFLVYGMSGLRDDAESIFKHCFILVIESLIALQVLYFAAVVTPNQDMAFMLAIGFTAVNILLSNYFIPFELIRFDWISWLQYFSAMGYTFEGAVLLEFGDRNFTCSEGVSALGNSTETAQALQFILPNTETASNPLVISTLRDPGEDCVLNGEAVNEFFDLDRSYGTTCGILIGYLAVLHVLTFLGLLFLAKKDKR